MLIADDAAISISPQSNSANTGRRDLVTSSSRGRAMPAIHVQPDESRARRLSLKMLLFGFGRLIYGAQQYSEFPQDLNS